MDEDATFLQEQAEKCRRLARSVYSENVTSTLLGTALDCENRAEAMNEREARLQRALSRSEPHF